MPGKPCEGPSQGSLGTQADPQSNGSQPVGQDPFGVNQAFHWGLLKPSGSTEIYITIHDSNKNIVMK